MNYLDLIIIIILIISAITGYKNGFISQLTSLAALILGIFLSVKFSKLLSPWLIDHFSWSPAFTKITSFIIIFILVLIFIGILGRAIEKSFEQAELGHFNKIIGLFFSLIKNLVILSIITLVLSFCGKDHSFPDKEDKHNSLLYMPVASILPAIYPYLDFSKKEQTEKK